MVICGFEISGFSAAVDCGWLMLFGQVWSRWLHLGGIHSSAQTQNRGWDTSVCSLSLSWFFGIVYVTWTVHSCTLHPHFFPDCSSDFILWIVSLWVSQHMFSAKLHLFLCCGLFVVYWINKRKIYFFGGSSDGLWNRKIVWCWFCESLRENDHTF